MTVAYVAMTKNKLPSLSIAIQQNKSLIMYEFDDTYSFEIFASILIHEQIEQVFLLQKYGILNEFLKNVFVKIKLCYIDRKEINIVDCKCVAKAMFASQINDDIENYNVIKRNLPGRMVLSDNFAIDLDIINKEKSIYSILDNTNTKMGNRLLLQNLLYPFTDILRIKERQKSVLFFAKDSEKAETLDLSLKKVPDIDALVDRLARINEKHSKIECISLAANLHGVLALYKNFTNIASCTKNDLESYDNDVDIALHTINSVCDFENIMYVKNGIDPYLDVSIQMYKENEEDMLNKIQNMSKSLDVQFSMVHNHKFGMVIKVLPKYYKILENVTIETENVHQFMAFQCSKSESWCSEDDTDSLIGSFECETSPVDFLLQTTHNNSFCVAHKTDNSKNTNAINNNYKNNNDKQMNKSNHDKKNAMSSKQTNDTIIQTDNAKETLNDQNNSTKELTNNEEFILLIKKKEFLLYTTANFYKLNLRLISCKNQIIDIFYEYCYKMIMSLKHITKFLHYFSKNIAETDIALSFYKYMLKNDAVTPENGNSISLTLSTHPLVKKQKIGNCVFAPTDMNFNIVTGANMSGKSTYIKQIGIAVILNQIGASLTAKHAKLRCFNKLYTQLTREHFDEQSSSFIKELNNTKMIIDNCDENTLVLLDELGRGTNYTDSLAFVVTVCEELLQKNSYVFFATHFTNITSYLDCENVNALQLLANRLKSGITKESLAFDLCLKYLGKKVYDDTVYIRKMLCDERNTEYNNSNIQIAHKTKETTDKKEQKKLKNELAKRIKAENKNE
ncbi:MutS protein msh4 [Binucleata daphniae]